jgi:rubredoxin
LKNGEQMEKRRCRLFAYVFVEEKGDPGGGLEPGTKFEVPPRDWVCPVCGAEKGQL